MHVHFLHTTDTMLLLLSSPPKKKNEKTVGGDMSFPTLHGSDTLENRKKGDEREREREKKRKQQIASLVFCSGV